MSTTTVYQFAIDETIRGLTREAYRGTFTDHYEVGRPARLAQQLRDRFKAQRFTVRIWSETTTTGVAP